MPAAMKALATTTLTSTTGNVTFSSIPSTYRDLRVVIHAKDAATTPPGYQTVIKLNSTTTPSTSWVSLSGNGTSAVSNSTTGEIGTLINYYSAPNNALSFMATVDILDYSATDKHKTSISRASNGGGNYAGVDAIISRFPSTSAVTSLQISIPGTGFAIGSTFSLYGVSA